jgi:hypothetical protein
MFAFIKKIFSKEEERIDLSPPPPPFTSKDIKQPPKEEYIDIDTISYIKIEKLFLINSADSLSKKNKSLLEEYKRWNNRRTNRSEVIREESKKKMDLILKLSSYYKSLE